MAGAWGLTTSNEEKMADKGIAQQEQHAFEVPKRAVLSRDDLTLWERSQAYSDFLSFVQMLNSAVKGKKASADYHVSEAVKLTEGMIEKMDMWIDEIPPTDQPQRFGNKAYRTWFSRMEENAESLVLPLLPDKFKGASVELVAYLRDGFGNSTRIDYGTGHEASFAMFLCCLFKLRVFQERDGSAVVLKVFSRYLKLMRRLQAVYRMEPAGSQGVWGLDDFQFLPFIWGSSQLIGHQQIEPKSFVDEGVAKSCSDNYMFMGCIKSIYETKTGPFFEHSNTLWSISSIPAWTKVNSGLIKMYNAEVLSKFPVIQHFVFGTLMSIKPADKFKKPL